MKLDNLSAWLLMLVFFAGWIASLGPTGLMVAFTCVFFMKLHVALAQDVMNGIIFFGPSGPEAVNKEEASE